MRPHTFTSTGVNPRHSKMRSLVAHSQSDQRESGSAEPHFAPLAMCRTPELITSPHTLSRLSHQRESADRYIARTILALAVVAIVLQVSAEPDFAYFEVQDDVAFTFWEG
jgi:hypothetical protein